MGGKNRGHGIWGVGQDNGDYLRTRNGVWDRALETEG